MSKYKEIIPESFWKGSRKPKANTVEFLITQLAKLPKDLDIRIGFGEGCQLTVYNIDTGSMHLSIEEIEEVD